MGDKKKHRDKERSEEKKKNKKKSKDRGKDKDKQQLKKKKSEKRARSSSSSSYSSDSSSSDRSREKKAKKKKKDKQKTKSIEKQQKQTINMPFAISQSTAAVVPNPLTTIRPGLVIPPPAPIAATTSATIKPKTKQSHIFKLLPRLPLGCITVAKTIYSSSLFVTEGFESKMINSMCEELQKTLKAQGSKKMANVIGKLKSQINVLESKQKEDNHEMANEEKKFENQFELLKGVYNTEMNKLRQAYRVVQASK